jgi:hypothetical protein
MAKLELYLEARSKHGLSRAATGSIQTWGTGQLSAETMEKDDRWV